jgi:hypothetical protein
MMINDEEVIRLKDIIRRLAVEEHPSPEHSRFTSHPPGAPTAGQSGNSTKNGEIRNGRPGLKRATVEGSLARSPCRSCPEELTRATRIIKPGMSANVVGVLRHNRVVATKEAILEKRRYENLSPDQLESLFLQIQKEHMLLEDEEGY